MSINKWDRRYFELAGFVSKWSKDRSTQVGAVIYDDDNRLLSIGYNGFCQGADDDNESWHQRPLKYKVTEHAERNAFYSAVRNGVALKGANIALQWFPCTDCARGIVQVGIKKLVCPKPDFDAVHGDTKWGEDFKISFEILTQGKIKIEYIEG